MKYSEIDGLEWLAMYESGKTYEEISLETKVSTQTIRKWILAVGGKSRNPGVGKAMGNKHIDGIKGKREPSIKKSGHMRSKASRRRPRY